MFLIWWNFACDTRCFVRLNVENKHSPENYALAGELCIGRRITHYPEKYLIIEELQVDQIITHLSGGNTGEKKTKMVKQK
jgi:hypothetical protein